MKGYIVFALNCRHAGSNRHCLFALFLFVQSLSRTCFGGKRKRERQMKENTLCYSCRDFAPFDFVQGAD